MSTALVGGLVVTLGGCALFGAYLLGELIADRRHARQVKPPTIVQLELNGSIVRRALLEEAQRNGRTLTEHLGGEQAGRSLRQRIEDAQPPTPTLGGPRCTCHVGPLGDIPAGPCPIHGRKP